MEIDYIALFVSDVARSVAFYRDILGFEFKKLPKDSGCEGRSGCLKIGIYDRTWLNELFGDRTQQPVGGTPFLLSMTVSDLDAVYQDLMAKHVKIIKPPTQMPWGQRIVFLTDPDNNLLEIVQKSSTPTMVTNG
ncbi:VOC family protein [Pseudanabaena sp. PCC 6802]|uniref:VOC family protein n=1 Tax=Pseudanabaena sp. PCC 6802 TaxID=118173 RepID=UPI000344E4A7|nr:VOC family protein [Pseudanabaena sp. PCC 6802]